MLEQQHRILPAFVADCTLGKLAKWLRLAGFDTLYDKKPPDFWRIVKSAQSQDRFILSRTQRVIRHLKDTQGIFIESNDPVQQARQVIRYFNIQRTDLRPMSRCSRCNLELQAAEPEQIRSIAPDYIRQSHEKFQMCRRCLRLYWPGSHGNRIAAKIDSWFHMA